MTSTPDGVVLASNETGSSFFHRILSDAKSRFADLSGAHLPDSGGAFKAHYGEALVRYEAARIASSQRVEIAQALHDATLASLKFSRAGVELPILEALKQPVAAPRAVTREGTGEPGYVPAVPLDGHLYRGAEIARAVDKLHAAHHLTDAAAKGLRWVVDHITTRGGSLTLTNERFVVFGASAELSPAPLLLKAGATVRWVDVKPPPSTNTTAGTVIFSESGDDLLTAPDVALAAVREFAREGAVHLGLFAYAPGASRELRLAGVMDAMVQVLGAEIVKSVSLYISPTSPGEIQPEDLVVAAERGRAPKIWQRGFQAARMLNAPGHVGHANSPVARGIISLQGAGYQAAQYLTKLISAEALGSRGLAGKPVTLSANVAGITNTRSLSHPLFQVGFKGAPSFGVRIFEPDTTRALSGLLMLHDLLNPDAPGAASRAWPSAIERARALRTEQIHGGVYTVPWQFESAVRTAAVLGISKRPDLLLRRAKS